MSLLRNYLIFVFLSLFSFIKGNLTEPKLKVFPKVLKHRSPYVSLFCTVPPLEHGQSYVSVTLHHKLKKGVSEIAKLTNSSIQERTDGAEIRGAMDNRIGGYLHVRKYDVGPLKRGTYRCEYHVKLPNSTVIEKDSNLEEVKFANLPFYTSDTIEFLEAQNRAIGNMIQYNYQKWLYHRQGPSRVEDVKVVNESSLELIQSRITKLYEVTGARVHDYEANKTVEQPRPTLRRATVILRRISGSVDFDRTYADYEEGFGEPDGNVWIGLKQLHMLTSVPTKLEISMVSKNGTQLKVKYGTFVVGNKTSGYKLTIGNYTGPIGNNDMSRHDGMMFTTKDKDQDRMNGSNCAADYNGGWWYNSCLKAKPTGLYDSNIGVNGIIWRSFTHVTETLPIVEFVAVR